MTNDETGNLAAVTEIVGVHIDMTARREWSLPSDVRECANLMINDGDGLNRGEPSGMLAGGCR